MSHRWVLLFTSARKPDRESKKRIYEHFFSWLRFFRLQFSHTEMHFLVDFFSDWHILKFFRKVFSWNFDARFWLNFSKIWNLCSSLPYVLGQGRFLLAEKFLEFFSRRSYFSLNARIRALCSLSFSSVFAFEFYCFSRNYNLSFIVAIYFLLFTIQVYFYGFICKI